MGDVRKPPPRGFSSIGIKGGRGFPKRVHEFHTAARIGGHSLARIQIANSTMANGRIVLAITQHRTGGRPFKAVYYVNEVDPDKAKAIVERHSDPNVHNLQIEAWGPLPEEAVNALKLAPGEFVHFYE